MASFYDSLDSREVARVARILKRGGIEYTIVTAAGSILKEIRVAAEDVVYADTLLAAQSGSDH